MSPKTSVVFFLATESLEIHAEGDVFYVFYQNVTISLACLNNRLYFSHLTKNPSTKPVDFETRKCKTPGSFLHMSALFTVILTSCLLSFLWSLKSCDCFYEVGTTIYCSAIFSVLSLCVVAPFRRYGDVMCVPSIPRLLKALLQLFEVVLKSTPCTEHRVHCSSKRKSSHESHVSCIESQCQCPQACVQPRMHNCNRAQRRVATMLAAVLTASGYSSTMAIFTLRHTSVRAARINRGEVEHRARRRESRPEERFTKHQKLVD